MRIDFYHWGYQCPIIDEMLETLKNYEGRADIRITDINERVNTAKQLRMYFPFLTVFDGKHRWRGPLNTNILNRAMAGENMIEKPYLANMMCEKFYGDIKPLVDDNMDSVAAICTLTECERACRRKRAFLSGIAGKHIYGYVNMYNGKVKGGIEYVPSSYVPYDIPKREDIAFITCTYSLEEYDYRHFPLLMLEKHLIGEYKLLIAVCDEAGVFPNGPLKWFIDEGFEDRGVISVEKAYCKLHLVAKNL